MQGRGSGLGLSIPGLSVPGLTVWGIPMLGIAMRGMPVSGCPICCSGVFALGGGGAKELLAARGPLPFQLWIGLEAFAAVEQEAGEGVDGHAALENEAQDMAVALCLLIEEGFLTLLLLLLLGFEQALAFLGDQDLRGVVDGFFYHDTFPFCWRAQAARRGSEWSEGFCESPKKF